MLIKFEIKNVELKNDEFIIEVEKEEELEKEVFYNGVTVNYKEEQKERIDKVIPMKDFSFSKEDLILLNYFQKEVKEKINMKDFFSINSFSEVNNGNFYKGDIKNLNIEERIIKDKYNNIKNKKYSGKNLFFEKYEFNQFITKQIKDILMKKLFNGDNITV